MKIRGLKIKFHSNDDTHAGTFFPQWESRVFHCLCRDFEHQQLLREYVRDFAGRYVKFSDVKREGIHIAAIIAPSVKKALCNRIASPPSVFRPFSDNSVAVENGFLKISQGFQRAENSLHADDGDGRMANGEW